MHCEDHVCRSGGALALPGSQAQCVASLPEDAQGIGEILLWLPQWSQCKGMGCAHVGHWQRPWYHCAPSSERQMTEPCFSEWTRHKDCASWGFTLHPSFSWREPATGCFESKLTVLLVFGSWQQEWSIWSPWRLAGPSARRTAQKVVHAPFKAERIWKRCVIAVIWEGIPDQGEKTKTFKLTQIGHWQLLHLCGLLMPSKVLG